MKKFKTESTNSINNTHSHSSQNISTDSQDWGDGSDLLTIQFRDVWSLQWSQRSPKLSDTFQFSRFIAFYLFSESFFIFYSLFRICWRASRPWRSLDWSPWSLFWRLCSSTTGLWRDYFASVRTTTAWWDTWQPSGWSGQEGIIGNWY